MPYGHVIIEELKVITNIDDNGNQTIEKQHVTATRMANAIITDTL